MNGISGISGISGLTGGNCSLEDKLAHRRALQKIRREKVKREVDAIRAQTVCAQCGAQPIDWHNPEHKHNRHRQISQMVWTRNLAAIVAEIDACEPLCRPCHMKRHLHKTQCPHGHDLTDPANVAVWGAKSPTRTCRICKRERWNKRAAVQNAKRRKR